MSASNKTIVIRKIGIVPGGLKPINFGDYAVGTVENADKNQSLPVQYEVEGNLLVPMEVGKSVYLKRTKRNGISVSGLFQTSPLTEISENTFKTQNSVYTYNYI